MILNKEEILKITPHREPFLFVDEIIELVPGQRAVGIYKIKEEDCQGHFPGLPIMPGVLLLEAMNQVGAVALLKGNEDMIPLLLGADKVRFKKRIRPGDVIKLEVEKIREGKIGLCQAKAFLDDQLVAQAEIFFSLISKSQLFEEVKEN